VTESTATRILTGENLTRVEGSQPYITKRAVDILAPDLQKCSGLLEFRKICALADAFDMPVAPHNISSPVGTVASVHACATVPNAFVLE
jgi:galactonate dehydratase